MPRRRGQLGMVMAGAVVVAGGLAVGVVELLHYPKGSVWIVVGATLGVVALIRGLISRRR